MASASGRSGEPALLHTGKKVSHHHGGLNNPVRPEPDSPMFADEGSRFKRDIAGELQQQKLAEIQRKQAQLDRRREQHEQQEARRQQALQQQAQEAEQCLVAKRSSGSGGRRNKSSEHFNIINLDYHPTREGKALQYKDDVVKYRAVLRSQNLFVKAHSVPHNIITGEPRRSPVVLAPPPVPPST